MDENRYKKRLLRRERTHVLQLPKDNKNRLVSGTRASTISSNIPHRDGNSSKTVSAETFLNPKENLPRCHKFSSKGSGPRQPLREISLNVRSSTNTGIVDWNNSCLMENDFQVKKQENTKVGKNRKKSVKSLTKWDLLSNKEIKKESTVFAPNETLSTDDSLIDKLAIDQDLDAYPVTYHLRSQPLEASQEDDIFYNINE